MEIIEIGALWATAEGALLDRFQIFVRPLQRPRLTSFCTSLTGILQGDIDAAAPFAIAAKPLAQFAQEGAQEGSVWMSWGAYDLKQIERDCARHAVQNPLRLPHQNAKQLFAKRQRLNKPTDLAGACRLAKIGLEGRYHRALDDAVNTARLLPWILGGHQVDALSADDAE